GKYYQAAGRRSPDNPDRFKVFAPRLGFAYRPGSDEKTVVRGGYGRFYDSAEGREIDGAADIYPYVSRGIYSQSVYQPTPYKTNNLLMRINIAQALEYTPSNPTVAGRKPFPNFGVYIDSTWSGTSKYNGINAKLEHHGRALLATFAYTWSKSTDSKSAAAGIG